MKIFCIGRNYAQHAKEMGSEVPEEPIIFMKPKSALVQGHTPFYYPEFTNELHYEAELVVRISKNGKYIQEKHASNYYNAISVGIDFTARDIQSRHKTQGLPWELAKAFDGSAPVSTFVSKSDFADLYDLNIKLDVNGQTRQQGNTKDLLFSFERLIAFLSAYITLKKGDLIFTGTPAGVAKVAIGDHLEGYLQDKRMLDFYVK